MVERRTNSITSGLGYLSDGFKLLLGTRLRAYALVPIIINIALFIALTYYMFGYFNGLMLNLENWLWEWLHFLLGVIWFLVGLLILVVYGYLFNIITGIIAAPFYGTLAQQTEEMLTGNPIPDESFSQMIPRTIAREFSKQIYILPRSVALFLLTLFIAFLSPILFLWTAWCLAIQYADYGPDNHQLTFKHTRELLGSSRWSALGFGGGIMLCSMIPLINIIAMPAAVVGGTCFWVNEMKNRKSLSNEA